MIAPLKDWTCAGCGGSGDLLIMEDDAPLCLACADLDHLVSRAEARDRVRADVAAVLDRWRG